MSDKTHRQRSCLQSRTPYTIWGRGGITDGRTRDLANEPDVMVVDDIETTTQEAKGQDDKKVVAETEVTHHNVTEDPTNTMVVTLPDDTNVTLLIDIEVTAPVDTKMTALVDREVTALSSTKLFVHTDG